MCLETCITSGAALAFAHIFYGGMLVWHRMVLRVEDFLLGVNREDGNGENAAALPDLR